MREFGRFYSGGFMLLLLGLFGCKGAPSSFYLVETDSYGSFLWTEEKLPYGELVLDVSYISEVSADLEVSIDIPGVKVEPESIQVNGNERIRFVLSKSSVPEEDVKDTGSILLSGPSIHTVNGKPISTDKFGTVMLRTDKVMNPLARVLLLVFLTMLSLALLYSFTVRPLLFARFQVAQIKMEKPQWQSFRVRKYYRIQISQAQLEKSWWKRFVEGKTYAVISPGLPKGMVVTIFPQGKNRIRVESTIGHVSNRYAAVGQDVKITSESTGEALVQFK